MVTSPSATPAPTDRSGMGCLVAVLLLPVVIIAGLLIGARFNQGEDPDDEMVHTLDAGTIDGIEWNVNAVRDVDGEICAFLYQDGEQLTGGCSLEPEDATIGDQTVVFGRAANDLASVRILLDTGAVVEIDTVTAEGIDGRFYVEVVEGDVDAEGTEG